MAICVAMHANHSTSYFNPLQNNQMCVYKYRAMQEDFDDEMKLDTSVTTTVVLSCDAGE